MWQHFGKASIEANFSPRRYPIRMSSALTALASMFTYMVSHCIFQGRAWVFIISVACFLYGLGLTMQQLAAELRTLTEKSPSPDAA